MSAARTIGGSAATVADLRVSCNASTKSANHRWMVLAAKFRHHRFPAHPPLDQGHRERGRDGPRHAVDIVRIDQQRGIQFIGGAGEFRQHQHAGIGGILRRDIFLGHEIHAVMQRRHHADLGGAIEARQHGLAETLVEIADRGPVDFAMTAIDVADQLGEFVLQIAIGFDGAARRRRDLQQATPCAAAPAARSTSGRMR